MMVVNREDGRISHHHFAEFSDFVGKDDLLVLNDTRVVSARYFSNDGTQEILRVDTTGERRWKCLVKPGKRFKPGHTIKIGTSVGTVVEVCAEGGERIIEFDALPDESVHGHLALPPYIHRSDEAADKDRYQTVFSNAPGAIAAPTAGLHFSEEMLAGLPHVFVTLHVGIGTFRPVSSESLGDHHMHRERYELRPDVAAAIQASRRTFAVGTTAVRVLETCARNGGGTLAPGSGETDIFIYPPYQFKAVDALLTNFHLSRSTLLMLVSAFAGRDLILEAYRRAVEERYRFFSYGDCMLII